MKPAINLEHLILESVEKKEKLNFKKLVYIGGKHYVLAFNIVGKILTVDRIQKLKNKRKSSARSVFRKRWRQLRLRSLEEKPKKKWVSSQSTQTDAVDRCNKGTCMSKLSKRSSKKSECTQTEELLTTLSIKATQTEENPLLSVGSQASILNTSRGIQTESNGYNCSSQTDIFQSYDISIQAVTLFTNNYTQTEENPGEGLFKTVEEPKDCLVDQDMIGIMLNEIGEITMRHLGISGKNMDISIQLYDVMKKMLNTQKMQLRILEPLAKCESFSGIPKLSFSECTQTENLTTQAVAVQTINSRLWWKW